MTTIGGLAAGVNQAAGGLATGGDPVPPDANPRVRWTDQLVPAFGQAIDERKPLVGFFRKDFSEKSEGPSQHCRLIGDVFLSEAAGDYAGRGVWVWQSVETGNRNLCDAGRTPPPAPAAHRRVE